MKLFLGRKEKHSTLDRADMEERRLIRNFPWGNISFAYRVKQGRIYTCCIDTDREDVIAVKHLQENLHSVVALGATMAETIKDAVEDPDIAAEVVAWLDEEMHL